MGLFSIFSKKVNNFEQYTAELEKLQQEESATEAEEEKDVRSENQLAQQFFSLTDKKAKIVASQVAYFKAIAATSNAMKNLTLSLGNAFRTIGFKPKKAFFRISAAKQVLFGGSSQEAMIIADENIKELDNKVDQMNAELKLEKAQSDPIFQICIDKLGVIKQQKEILKTLMAILSREKKDIEKEAQKAEKIVEDLQEEFDDLRMDAEIIKVKRKNAQDRLYKRAA